MPRGPVNQLFKRGKVFENPLNKPPANRVVPEQVSPNLNHPKFNFNKLKIDKEFVSIFASGTSIDNLSDEDYAFIKEKSFVIGTNAFLSRGWIPRLLVWSDVDMSEYLDAYLKVHGKHCLLASREQAFERGKGFPWIYHNVDYFYSKEFYGLDGNFTFYWVLQLIKKFFPDKKILCFGMDGYPYEKIEKIDNKDKTHYYDSHTDMFIKKRDTAEYLGVLTTFVSTLSSRFKNDPEFARNVFNCNPRSMIMGAMKADFRLLLS